MFIEVVKFVVLRFMVCRCGDDVVIFLVWVMFVVDLMIILKEIFF